MTLSTEPAAGAPFTRTPTRLADGRELIYFDEPGAPARLGDDRRELPEQTNELEIRHDPLLDTWVGIASHRQERTFLPSEAECPLCPSTPDHATEIPAADYGVAVFENRFPSFAASAPPIEPVAGIDDAVERAAAGGRCEVVCFTSQHDASFAGLTAARARLVVEVWADRTSELGRLATVQQVFPFENRGEEIGVTLRHPHGQVYGYPFVTPHTARTLESARRHLALTGRNLFADVIEREQAARCRVVAENEHWLAFVPGFARWPFEIHLYPRRQVPDLPALTSEERDDCALIYLDLLRRFDRLFNLPLPYIAGWHQAPVRSDRDLAYLHLELFSILRAPGKLKYLAGSESSMGVWINDVRPEEAARMLRDASEARPG